MRTLLATITITGTLFLPIGAQAQGTPPEPPKLDQARVVRASEVARGEFVDPGNEQAGRFAKERGISVGEATSQLKRQAALGAFIERLKQRYPDKFSFVSVSADQITVGLTDPSVDIKGMLPPGLANVKAVQAVYSEQGTYAKLDDLREQVSAAGLKNVTIGVNSATGEIEFMTKSGRSVLEKAIKAGSIKVEHGYTIVDDEVVPTASLDGGRAYNVDTSICSDLCGGTTGFSLISTATSARYVSTAGHISNSRARYNTSTSSTYSSGGTSLGTPVDMFNYYLDVQYAPPSNTTDNFPNPYFWDGSAYVTVTNYTFPTTGVTFCKYGRSTGKACGVHDDAALTFSNTGSWGTAKYLKRIKNNGTGSRFNDEGDSGGPVYYGNWALGWMHGHNSNYDIYYTPVDTFKQLQTAIDLIIYK
jgi:hypothetical protein